MTQTLTHETARELAEVVSIERLRVRYGDTLAVDDVSLSIERGEIFGILGPNGAGKTTTVECIGGLRRPDAGQIRVLGLEVPRQGKELRSQVGIQLQASELPDKLRVGEAVRDKGYLRRLSTTPVGASRLLAAQIVIDLALEAASVVLILVIARVAFSVPLPEQFGGFLLAILLTISAMLGFGVLIAAVAPSQRVAAGIGSLLLFPLMFFAGLWVPQAEMGAGLRDVSHYTPLGAAAAAVQSTIAGHWPGSAHLLVLAGYAAVLCALAVRFFRWDR